MNEVGHLQRVSDKLLGVQINFLFLYKIQNLNIKRDKFHQYNNLHDLLMILSHLLSSYLRF